MDLNDGRNFMEALIQQGQGRRCLPLVTMLWSYHEVSAYIYLKVAPRGEAALVSACHISEGGFCFSEKVGTDGPHSFMFQ